MKFSTKAIHIGNEPNLKLGGSGDVVIPIHLSTTFARKNVFIKTNGLEYSRTGNPTRQALENNIAVLENGKYAFAYSSGSASIANILFLLKKGDHVVTIDDVYGGTRRLFTQVFEKFGIEFTYANFWDAKSIKKYIKENTKIIWIETPTNPLLKIVDIKSITEGNKRKGILTVVDNTFATPYFQKPLDLGADIVTHSLTKYIAGHSDVVGGAAITSNEKIASELKFLQNAVGSILSPFDSYSVLRGIKTLALRMEKHNSNAQKIAKYLSKHIKVKKIYYPGFGGVISFELKGDLNTAIKFMEGLKIISIAESLGAVESLIEHPASMTHSSVPKKERDKIGLSDTLIRLSVGIEDSEDIIKDLTQALS